MTLIQPSVTLHVMWLCCGSEPTKISRKYLEDGTKVRVSKKTGTIIPKPDPLADRQPRSLGTLPMPSSMRCTTHSRIAGLMINLRTLQLLTYNVYVHMYLSFCVIMFMCVLHQWSGRKTLNRKMYSKSPSQITRNICHICTPV